MLSFEAVYINQLKAESSRRPNIVFIMADDMGYGDAGFNNPESKIPTPHINRLAREGIRFTDAHSPAAVCVTTRYGLMTGRYPFRMQGYHGHSRIAPERLTLGGMLRKHGYATVCVGKWHLGIGGKNPDYSQPLRGGPVDRGFDYFFGMHASLDIPPYYYIENDRCVAAPTDTVARNNSPDTSPIQGAFWRAGKIAPGLRHVDVLPKFREKAVEAIERHVATADEKPLFLYLALTAPHTPRVPSDRFRGKTEAGDYGDFTAQVDDVVGEVLRTLERHGMSDDTLIFFTSDNGPLWYANDIERYGHRSNLDFRGTKGDIWEGGHRMPFVARWPGRIKPGTSSDELICHTDMLATFASILGNELPEGAGADSFSILPILLGKEREGAIREALVSQSSGNVLAIRQGPWKLVPMLGSGGFTKPRRVEPTPDGPQGQLYNLDEDISESKNLWLERPEIVARLTRLLEKYQHSDATRH